MSNLPDSLRVSIVILTNQRPALLKRCLDSILQNRIDITKTEVIVVVNGPGNSETLEVLKKFPRFFQTIEIPRSYPGEARNYAIRAARFEWLFFLDDDAFLSQETFSRLERSFQDFPDCDVLAGPNLTPAHSSPFQNAAGKALASRFGNHLSSRRFCVEGGKGPCGEEAANLSNLLVRKNILIDQNIYFHPKLACNEENLLIQEMQSKGAKVYYDSRFYVFHNRRSNLMDFGKALFKYGLGRSQNTRIRPSSFRWQHGLASFCMLFSLFAPLHLLLPLMSAYFILLLLSSFLNREIRLIYIFPLIHFSYGLGFLTGCLFYVPYSLPLSRKVAVWALSATGRIARS